MKTPKVIARKNIPTRLPLFQSITALLALQHWNAPQWLYGAAGLYFLIIWIVAIVSLIVEEQTDLFKDK